jgi:hypothetical protein
MNKVTWTGLIVAVLTAIIPLLQGESITIYSAGFSVSIAALSFLTKNMKGQVWTILGIVTAAAINFFTAHPEPSGITVKYVLASYVLPLLIQISGAAAHTTSEKQ